jgi:DNA-binding transcriptional ArsR family regulator
MIIDDALSSIACDKVLFYPSIQYFKEYRIMDEKQVVTMFGALSQETRLRIIRMLVVAGPAGMAAGSIAEAAGVSASNVSFHLKELERAGLVAATRESRSIIYTAAYEQLSGLIRFLMEDCCAGRPEICAPATAVAAACCVPLAKENLQ